ncbi:MAG: hypothetical protein AMJ75_00385 [Phycisphaerae bacterium SM1_79]|nr:MAG: hypothetical protein AMJ75_00385 [Phycisphaerae bacterium SM1_79]
MSDLTLATRELFVRALINEVHMKTPVVEELQRRNQVMYRGGKYLEQLVVKGTMEGLVQEYTVNQALTDEKTEMLEKPRWQWKYAQLPLRYDADEATQNISAGKEEQLLDLADFLASQGHDGMRRWLCKMIFNSGSTTAVADGGTKFQSAISALDHDTTYGTLSRSISGGTNDWWQGADPADLTQSITSSSQDTSYNLTIYNLRKWVHESDIAHYMESDDDLYVCMCPTLFNKLRAEAESKIEYNPGQTQNNFVTKAKIDNLTCVSVPYLQTSSTMKTWLFILNMKYWFLYLHRDRNFKVTDFKWQGDQANGYDRWLARIMVKGNLVCNKPNSSMWLSAIS